MINLSQKKILILDCQTTGMHPSTGSLLQIGWSIVAPSTLHEFEIEKWTLKLPKEEAIPSKIKKMLHLTDEDLKHSVEPKIVFENLQSVLKELGLEPIVLAHYAQFENSFLKQFYLEQTQTDELNFKLLCTQKIAKRLLPHLPSHNLKAIAGYFKWPNSPKNEINSHVSMTIHVWLQLLPKLFEQNIACSNCLEAWLATKYTNKNQGAYHYNIERLERLKLSNKPGIYRMLAEDGTILYIGKATSLKARVNSYFRGTKNRDRRKLEMLTQVWDIETIECDTPLEAALLESDEIKKWTPPYNVLLKSDSRSLIYYNDDYSKYNADKSSIFIHGPYKTYDALAILIEFFNAFKTQVNIEYRDAQITPETLNSAYSLFCAWHQLNHQSIKSLSIRSSLVIGYKLLKQFEKVHRKGSFQKWWTNEKKKNSEDELVIEEKIAHKMARILIRAAEAKRKNRMILRLSNATFLIQSTQKKIILRNGEIIQDVFNQTKHERSAFELLHYDRLSILLSALNNKTITLI
ncbi:GIY-YIG nuclease family protein [Legionella sainthelensi]|uniref:Excinuclease ABC subunit C n=1 Tax=Legionella sainthelensi TaxID=28087 RepID=A0A2H5FMB8_9GAMM|nr:GIY-YIG nuclease family protein [Legionella sainthelensi]AUH72683.1 excinuclease ABC subunit C [Legionella sainthelensi]